MRLTAAFHSSRVQLPSPSASNFLKKFTAPGFFAQCTRCRQLHPAPLCICRVCLTSLALCGAAGALAASAATRRTLGKPGSTYSSPSLSCVSESLSKAAAFPARLPATAPAFRPAIRPASAGEWGSTAWAASRWRERPGSTCQNAPPWSPSHGAPGRARCRAQARREGVPLSPSLRAA
jgi:hypothetical protein